MKKLKCIIFIYLAGAILGGQVLMAAETLQDKVIRIGAFAGMSGREARRWEPGFTKKVLAVARNPRIKVAPYSLLSAVVPIIWVTKDMKFAAANLENIGVTIMASSASPRHVGYMIAALKKSFGLSTHKEILEAIGTLYKQSKLGPISFKEFAPLFPRIAKAYEKTGRAGVGAVREAGALFQFTAQSGK